MGSCPKCPRLGPPVMSPQAPLTLSPLPASFSPSQWTCVKAVGAHICVSLLLSETQGSTGPLPSELLFGDHRPGKDHLPAADEVPAGGREASSCLRRKHELNYILSLQDTVLCFFLRRRKYCFDLK